MLKTALFVLLVYLAFAGLVFLTQRKMLYLPIGAQLTVPQAEALGMRHWPSSEDFRGYVGDAAGAAPRGTIVVFHGNAGAAGDRYFYVDGLSRLGYRVLLAEYPGYAGRSGTPTEKALVADAFETVARARQAFGEPVILLGESLGCGVANAVAADPATGIRQLILITPWDSLAAVAQAHYWYLPARWLLLDRYDNIRNLELFDGRVAVLLAEHDEVVPNRHGRALYEAIAAEKKLWVLDGAGHNTLPMHPGAPWWREVAVFLSD